MKIHFIGIGGIGVSALAQYYIEKDHEVSGSDLAHSEITEMMEKKGAKIFLGNSADNISADLDFIVHTSAVKSNNPEFTRAKELGIKTKVYHEALAELTKEYFTIAVSGAHGKSTTTSMISLILVKAGLDPTVIVGTKLKEFGNTNFRMGNSKYLVVEACEYESAFLHYSPKIAVITNVDKEHLDYFKTFANIKKTFRNYIEKIPADGVLVFNKDDKNIPRILKPKFSSVGYSLRQKESIKLKRILKLPGKHNISNALAALSVGRILNIKDSISFKSLSEFTGTWRRFDMRKGKIGKKNITLISDYGHHPTEVLATLKAAREKFPKKNIICIFQPHQHQRTFNLLKDFIKTFRSVKINKILITDIYDVAGRETKIINSEISAEKLVKKVNKKNIIYCATNKLEEYLNKYIKTGDVLLIMGAGDIYNITKKI